MRTICRGATRPPSCPDLAVGSDDGSSDLRAREAEHLRPRNAGQAENFRPVPAEDHFARVEPILTGQNDDVDLIEISKCREGPSTADPFGVRDPPACNSVTAADDGHELPAENGQADWDRRQGEQFSQGEETATDPKAAERPTILPVAVAARGWARRHDGDLLGDSAERVGGIAGWSKQSVPVHVTIMCYAAETQGRRRSK